jgi:hypothetical protein
VATPARQAWQVFWCEIYWIPRGRIDAALLF